MLDIKFVRSNLEVVQEVLDARGMEVDLVGFAQYDEERRDILRDLGRLKHIRNLVSHQIGKMKKRGDDASEQIKKMREVSAQIKEMEAQVKVYEDKLERILGSIPNIPHSSVSFGPDDSGNIEIKRWGEIPEFGFPIQPHWDIGEALEILDFERGAKISGSRFPVSKHLGAKMERVLINFMLDIHIKEHGYTEVYPPLLAREECLFGTGQLPRFRDEMFSCKDEGLFLIPTSEVPLINIHRGEILKADQLPFYYVSCTPCFRKEAGSYGRDAKGLYRVHQFNMVELVKFVKPDDSYMELEKLVAEVEDILQRLELPYRVVNLCTGSLSFSAAKCYNIEVWSPYYREYREISSCSNYEDFQARRIGIRFHPGIGGKSDFVHTLDGSGLAVGRTMMAILENYQQADGSVVIPEALRPYMDGLKVLSL